MDVPAVYQGEGRDEPGVQAIIVRIQVHFQFTDPHCSQHWFQAAHSNRLAPVFFLLPALALFLSYPKGIKAKRDEKDPAPDVKKCFGRNQPDPDYSRQGDHIPVPGGIGVKYDRHQQKPEQEKEQQGYEDVPKHTPNLGYCSGVCHSKSAGTSE